MSRSRKKYPIVTDYSKNYTSFAKRQANKKVRKYSKTLSKGSVFKKLYCSWNIFDYKQYSNSKKNFRK